jgi:hypothetical protein
MALLRANILSTLPLTPIGSLPAPIQLSLSLTFNVRSARFRTLEGKVVRVKVHVFVHPGV